MKTKNTMTGGRDGRVVIATGFGQGFALLMPDGALLHLPPCNWRDDESFLVVESGQGFALVYEDSRDNGFAELKREVLPDGTMAAYNPEEGDRWQSLHDLGAASAYRESNAATQTTTNWGDIDDHEIMDGAWAIAQESVINILSDKELMGALVLQRYEDHDKFSANDVIGALFGSVRGGDVFSFDIVVDPTYQRRGAGRLLFDAGIQESRNGGFRLIQLEIYSPVVEAMAKKAGFVNVSGPVWELEV